MNTSVRYHNKSIPHGTFVSYRIRIKRSEVKPIWLTNTIGIEPSWALTAGEKYLARRPDGSGGRKEVIATYPFSVWGLTTNQVVDSDSLEKHCEYLATLLKPKEAVIKDLIDKTELFDIRLLLRIETEDCIFSDAINSRSLRPLVELSHSVDISAIFDEGTDSNRMNSY